MAFLGSVDGRTVDTEKDDLVWIALRGRSPRAVLREGTRLRGFAEARVGYLDDGPLLGPEGTILQFPRITGPADTASGLLHGRRGRRLRPIVEPGPADPHLAASIAGGPFSIGAEDQVLFLAAERPAPEAPLEETLFAWDGRAEPRIVVRTGQPAPDETDGTVRDFAWSVPNASGLPALRVEGSHRQYLLAPDEAGRYAERARSGAPPPGGPEGALLREIDPPWRNTAGDLAFAGVLEVGEGVDFDDDRAVWVLERDGSAQAVARTGDSAPGAPPGAVFSLLDLAGFADSGRALIHGYLSGDPVQIGEGAGYWLYDPADGLRAVFRSGDALPCVRNLVAWPADDTALAADGTVVLVAMVPEGDVAREALVAFPPSGGCTLIAMEGEPLLLGRRARVVLELDFSGPRARAFRGGRPLNDSGELVFTAEFEDGSSAILARRLGPSGSPRR